MFSFFKKKPPVPEIAPPEPAELASAPALPLPLPITALPASAPPAPLVTAPASNRPAQAVLETAPEPGAPTDAEQKKSWMARLKAGLSKTSSNISLLFVGAKIDDDLYEELETALLMADAGVEATAHLLDELK